MNIAVSAFGSNLDSQFSPDFCRSPGFMLFETTTNETVFLDNGENQKYSPDSDMQTAAMITETGPRVVITGEIAPEASWVLNQTEIEIYRCTEGTVKEALKAFQRKQLPELSTVKIPAAPAAYLDEPESRL